MKSDKGQTYVMIGISLIVIGLALFFIGYSSPRIYVADGKTYVYDDNDAVMTKIANPTGGDYVNFYTAGKKIYITAGTVAELDGASGLNKWTPHTYVNTPTISTKEQNQNHNVH